MIMGNCQNWRIDNCKFDMRTRGILTGHISSGSSYGLIDHCVFVAQYNLTAQGVSVMGDQDAAWERPQTLGTANAVYIEDCTFNYSYYNDGALDAYGGARYVFRNNIINGAIIGHHGRDSGNYRSPHSFEIYNNTFNNNADKWRMMHFRGGTGVVYNNTFTGTAKYGNEIHVTDYCTCKEVSSCLSSNWEKCTSYPCIDQIGRTTGMVLAPLYEWGNTLNGSDIDISVYDFPGCSSPSISDHIKEGRDFYNDSQLPNYTPYTYPHPLAMSDLPAQPIEPPKSFSVISQ